jgi:hypothetical protein
MLPFEKTFHEIGHALPFIGLNEKNNVRISVNNFSDVVPSTRLKFGYSGGRINYIGAIDTIGALITACNGPAYTEALNRVATAKESGRTDFHNASGLLDILNHKSISNHNAKEATLEELTYLNAMLENGNTPATQQPMKHAMYYKFKPFVQDLTDLAKKHFPFLMHNKNAFAKTIHAELMKQAMHLPKSETLLQDAKTTTGTKQFIHVPYSWHVFEGAQIMDAVSKAAHPYQQTGPYVPTAQKHILKPYFSDLKQYGDQLYTYFAQK